MSAAKAIGVAGGKTRTVITASDRTLTPRRVRRRTTLYEQAAAFFHDCVMMCKTATFPEIRFFWGIVVVISEKAGKIQLPTEADAWALLKDITTGAAKFGEIPAIEFGDWAKFTVYIDEEKYDSAITPYMMQGWVELQRAVYRAFSLAKVGQSDARLLTDNEKKSLELVVEVKSGSSDQAVDFQKIAETLVLAMVDKVEPEHIVLISVVSVLLFVGGSVTRTWLNNRKDIKLREIEAMANREVAKTQIEALATIASVAKEDRDRMVTLHQVEKVAPVVAEIEKVADDGMEAVVQHVSQDDAVVNGTPVAAAAGQLLTRKARAESKDVRLDGVYTVRKVDTTVDTGFRVYLMRKDGKEITADVADLIATLDDRDAIRDAEWNKVPLFLQINGKERRGEVFDAIIIRARPFDPTTDK